jgi:7-cyano-7-deazaguanine synthase
MYEEWICVTITNAQTIRNGIIMDKALVVLSGGQDSTTCLFWALDKYDKVEAITFDYGQRHSIEIEAARTIAKLSGIEFHEIVKVPDCLISASPLTSNNNLEKYESAAQMENVIGNRRELTFVPMRNALFLTIAANRAEAKGISTIITGVCQMDNANYDDCRKVFIDATVDYINYALGHDHRGTKQIKIVTPLMNLSKSESVKLAASIPGCFEALAYSHTSYDGKYPPTDMNHANVLRAQGFEEAHLPDPLVIRAWMENLMELPETSNYDSYRPKVN